MQLWLATSLAFQDTVSYFFPNQTSVREVYIIPKYVYACLYLANVFTTLQFGPPRNCIYKNNTLTPPSLTLSPTDARGYTYSSPGTGPIHMDNVGCVGTENRLSECRHSSVHNCDHSDDAGVTCRTRKCLRPPYLFPLVCMFSELPYCCDFKQVRAVMVPFVC